MMPAMKSVDEPGAIAALPDLLPSGSSVSGKAGAKSGQSGWYAQPVTVNTPSLPVISLPSQSIINNTLDSTSYLNGLFISVNKNLP